MRAERAEREREAEQETAREHERVKARQAADKLGPRITKAREVADDKLAAAAAAVVELSRISERRSEALRMAGASSGELGSARLRPHEVRDAWHYAQLSAGADERVMQLRALYANSPGPLAPSTAN